jgi:hypothetical protein
VGGLRHSLAALSPRKRPVIQSQETGWAPRERCRFSRLNRSSNPEPSSPSRYRYLNQVRKCIYKSSNKKYEENNVWTTEEIDFNCYVAELKAQSLRNPSPRYCLLLSTNILCIRFWDLSKEHVKRIDTAEILSLERSLDREWWIV